MKVGDIFVPKPGTMHIQRYGSFVGKVLEYDEESDYIDKWEVLEQGIGRSPVKFGNTPNSSTEDFEVITEIYNSPLYQALK